MKSHSGLGRPKGISYKVFWTTVFFLFVTVVVSSLYVATNEVAYVWRWFRVPQYFFYHEQVDIRAAIDGVVEDIRAQGSDTVVVVKGSDGEEEYVVPGKDAKVVAGDNVFVGDALGSYSRWKVGILLEGLWLTLEVSLLAIVIGIAIGLFTGLARISENPALKWSAITYIEIIRGSPLLVQIFIWYFVLGTLINDLLDKYSLPVVPSLWYGVASLAVFAGAYVAEIVRAGIQSIHRGQIEAARSLGMSHAQAMVHVILPQAFKRILPPLAGQFISLIKDSSLLGIIAIRELSKATREVVAASLQPFELWFMCALLYLLLTFALSMLFQYIERRMVSS